MFINKQQSDIVAPSTLTYRTARAEEIPDIAHLVAVSFGDYPFFGLAFRDAFNNYPQYLQFMEHFQRVHITAYARRQTCLVAVENGRIVSTAILHNPALPAVTLADYIRSGGIALLGSVAISRIANFLRFNESSHADCAKESPDAWYIETLAVDRGRKGKGLGRHMIHDCLAPYARFHGADRLTLNTNTEANRRFYVRNGFTQFAERTLTNNGTKLGNWSYRMDLR